MKRDEVINRVLPQFFPKSKLEASDIVHADFPSRIRVGYVLHNNGSYSYIIEEDFASLSMTLDELHAAALRNLERLPSASISHAKVANGAEGWIWATDDNFAAARILLPTVQEIFRQELGTQFLVALSHRDDCFCWSLTQDADRQEKHAQDALSAFLNEEYNLTPDILLCSNGSFHLHRQQDLAESETTPEV